MGKRTNQDASTRIEVTSENFGELLVQSAEEAVAIHEGRLAPARVRSYPVITARHAAASPPPRYTPEQIRDIRARTTLSQELFAAALNVSTETDKSWEQGKREPDGPSLRLLELVDRQPKLLLAFVKKTGARRVAESHRRLYQGKAKRATGARRHAAKR